MTLPLFRCRTDGRLLRRKDISKGCCLGHFVEIASEVSFVEYVKAKFWQFTGQL